jgi:putative hemolysin
MNPSQSINPAAENAVGVLPERLLPGVPRPVESIMRRVLGVTRVEELYRDLRPGGAADPTIAQRLLDHLHVTIAVSPKDLERVPRTGPSVVVVNHPFGFLDGAIVAALFGGLRPGVKILANYLLASIPELRDLLIPVDPFGGEDAMTRNLPAMKEALRLLDAGGMLIAFPAGAVSHFAWRDRTITDPPWSLMIARLIRKTGAAAVPVHVNGRNGALFQMAGALRPEFRTALLAHELLNKTNRRVEVRIGSPIPAEKLLSIRTDERRIEYLRWRTYVLSRREQFKPRTSLPLSGRTGLRAPELPVTAAVASDALANDIHALAPERLLIEWGEFRVYVAPAAEIPSVLREIGRLREVSFRAVGEGTGKPLDVDAFDAHYRHLFVWNHARREIVGAYRVAATDQVVRDHGIAGLYTATLFQYSTEFLDRIGPALELGRSFIRPEYQRTSAPLLLLWKGIGRLISADPRYKTLFGPVSISNDYHPVSRDLMVTALRRYAWMGQLAGMVSSAKPFRAKESNEALDLDDLNTVIGDIEPARAGMPVLLRQYLKLGGKLLGFNIDPNFSRALDGLILVDLTRTEPKLLDRYLGAREAAEFLAFHRR